jgi:hypothetical protein
MERAAQQRGQRMAAAGKKRLDQMSAQLGLDEAQRLEVQDVLARQVTAYVALWSAPPKGESVSGTGNSPVLDEMLRIDADADKAIRGILTPEQVTGYSQMPSSWFEGMSGGGR